ncbi:polysaccharide deacetylase family protein [Marinobacter mangrovi]|uniref:polysaccharide deacetylase family protein n=1 Tax=Marinobacter mangrovi TaxID=2803918 RepID=UPI00193182DE|nr:polysaccharide deacetylase family protein [Marinobacter mangrovi]
MYIFYGHRVLPDKQAVNVQGPDSGNVISVSNLERLLDRLTDYKCVSVDELGDMRDVADDRCYALTFDDGFKDNLDVLLPILKERGLQATYFVATRFLQGEIPFEYDLWQRVSHNGDSDDDYRTVRLQMKTGNYATRQAGMNEKYPQSDSNRTSERLMLSRDELVELSRESMLSIGSHSHSHLVLSRQLPWVAFNELSYSKRAMESWIGRRIEHFAYPYGARSFWTDWLARLAGYRSIFSTEAKRAQRFQFCMPRIPLERAHAALDLEL